MHFSIPLAFLVFIQIFFVIGSNIPPRAILKSRYTRAHSLGDNYIFDKRHGWQEVNVTNTGYKDLNKRGSMNKHGKAGLRAKGNNPALVKVLQSGLKLGSKVNKAFKEALDKVYKGMQPVGSKQKVTITWYNGTDLLNPSCWSNGQWAPTDLSFVCALTLSGWSDRPKCFKFLELCITEKTCVYVRVVDTCAGCANGSKHVDLTPAAFLQLAGLDEGVDTVQMREATEPDEWFEDLWGPKV